MLKNEGKGKVPKYRKTKICLEGLGAYSAMLTGYYWLCAQELPLLVVDEPYAVM